jgi:cystathionine beta-lyase/cystathionine gamma-synthase
MHTDTSAVHLTLPDDAHGAVAVPIYQTSIFAPAEPAGIADGLTRPGGAYVYSRYANPTVRALEKALAELEGGAAALVTASGMGAINAVLLGALRAGDHLVAQRRLYGGTHAVLADLEARFGIAVTYVSGADPEELRSALRPETRLLYLETIANPTGWVSDLPALAAVARPAGVLTVVDNTFATPVLCQPIRYGADVVVHALTKYIGGHSDVTGGAAVFADHDRYHRIWDYTVELGVAADPFAAWLTIRGLKTLPIRMRRQEENAALLAERLAAHPAVEAVRWPGRPDHPSHAVATRLLSGYGAVFTFDLAGGRAAADAFVSRVRLVRHAASLGGVETLVLHPASTSHRQLDAEQLAAAGIGAGTVRISVGIEHPDDLWDDLSGALAAGDGAVAAAPGHYL